MNGGIKIKDSGFEDFKNKYTKQMNSYSELIDDYLKELEYICENLILSGDVHDVLNEYRSEMVTVKEMPETLAGQVSNIIDTYLNDVDAAQKYNGISILYDKKYPGVKDYSAQYFNDLGQLIDESRNESDFSNLLKGILSEVWMRILKIFGKADNSKTEKIQKTQDELMYYYDITKKELGNIARAIFTADEYYGKQLDIVKDSIDNIEQYIEQYEIIMQNACSGQTFELNLDRWKFKDKFDNMMRAYNKVCSIADITDEDVELFISSDGLDDYTNLHITTFEDYMIDLSGMETNSNEYYKMLIFQMFDIAETQVISGGDYEKMITKKELIDMMDDLAPHYVYSDSDEKKSLDDFSLFIKYYKKYGEKWYEYLNTNRDKNGKLLLDGRTKEAKEFKNFIEGLGNAKDILKYGDQAINILSKLFIDYDKNLEFLDSFEKNAVLSDKMKECYAEIRATYEHNLLQTLKDTGIQINKNIVDRLYSISIGTTIGSVKNTIGILGDVTGENAKTEAQLELMTYGFDEAKAAETAFKNALIKLKEANKVDENYGILVNDFKNCFSAYKCSYKRLFEKAAKASTGSKRDYYYYCSSEISSMSLKDISTLKMKTYDEYMKEAFIS